MKRIAVILLLLVGGYSNFLFAQQPNKVTTTSSQRRNVVGVVRDAAGIAIQGVNIKLLLPKDTLHSVSSQNGTFAFSNISAVNVILKFEMLGYQTQLKKYFLGEAKAQFIAEPVVLNEVTNLLKEVVIKSKPTILLKPDTVEYSAPDYAIEKRDRVAELIEKMQDVTVDYEGKVKYMGEDVLAAKLNGRLYEGGELAKAIKNLPAEIVDKIQFIDDYGEKAEATGVKSGPPTKVLNIVTRTDKSVGNSLKIGATGSNNESYESDVNASRINKNLNYSIRLKTANDLQGLPDNISSSPSLSSGGNSRKNDASFSYANRFKQGELTFGYNYAAYNSSLVNYLFNEAYTTYGSIFSDIADDSKNINSNNGGYFSSSNKLGKNGKFKLSAHFGAGSGNDDSQRTINKTGSIINQRETIHRFTETKNGNFSSKLIYTQKLNEANRNFYVEASYRSMNNETPEEQAARFYSDNGQTLDSLLHRYFDRNNKINHFTSAINFTEPLNKFHKISASISAEDKRHDVSAITTQLDNGGYLERLYGLDNIYSYNLTKSQFNISHTFDNNAAGRYISAFIALEQTVLKGSQLAHIAHRTQLNAIINVTGRLKLSKSINLLTSYSRRPREIDFLKLYAVPNVSSPQHYIIGNPNLKLNTTNDFSLNISETKLGQSIRFGLRGNLISDAVINNNTQIFENGKFLRNETSYINAGQDYSLNATYGVNKNVKRGYVFSFEGNTGYRKSATMNNNTRGSNLQTNLVHTVKFTAVKRLGYIATVQHNYLKNNNTLNHFIMVTNRIQTGLDINYRMKSMRFAGKVSKNFIYGMSFNQTKNPIVINAQYDLSVMKGLIDLNFIAYDVLKQNNMVYLQFSDLGKSETKSNLSSRFFVVKAVFNLQKWTPAKSKNNTPIIRKGDGTFL